MCFDPSFFRNAAVIMATRGLDSGYLKWLYEKCVEKKPTSLAGYYFACFKKERYAEAYLEERSPPEAPPLEMIVCPVCGAEHPAGTDCPQCGLEHLHDKYRIEEIRRFWNLGQAKRDEFNRRQDEIWGKHDDLTTTGKQLKDLRIEFCLEEAS
jgi:hypothetical protein